MNNFIRILHDEIKDARKSYDEALEEVYSHPECQYCDEEMEIGSLGGGKVTFGCYRDDCPYTEETGYRGSYSITRKTASSHQKAERYDTLLNLCHSIALEEKDGY